MFWRVAAAGFPTRTSCYTFRYSGADLPCSRMKLKTEIYKGCKNHLEPSKRKNRFTQTTGRICIPPPFGLDRTERPRLPAGLTVRPGQVTGEADACTCDLASPEPIT